MQLQATQIRAARAILDWSQEELAGRSGVGITTIRQVEGGCVPRRQTAISLRGTFENAGLEFIESEGVRVRVEHINVLVDQDSCRRLYDDILQTILSGADEVMACVSSYQVFTEILTPSLRTNILQQPLPTLSEKKATVQSRTLSAKAFQAKKLKTGTWPMPWHRSI